MASGPLPCAGRLATPVPNTHAPWWATTQPSKATDPALRRPHPGSVPKAKPAPSVSPSTVDRPSTPKTRAHQSIAGPSSPLLNRAPPAVAPWEAQPWLCCPLLGQCDSLETLEERSYHSSAWCICGQCMWPHLESTHPATFRWIQCRIQGQSQCTWHRKKTARSWVLHD